MRERNFYATRAQFSTTWAQIPATERNFKNCTFCMFWARALLHQPSGIFSLHKFVYQLVLQVGTCSYGSQGSGLGPELLDVPSTTVIIVSNQTCQVPFLFRFLCRGMLTGKSLNIPASTTVVLQQELNVALAISLSLLQEETRLGENNRSGICLNRVSGNLRLHGPAHAMASQGLPSRSTAGFLLQCSRQSLQRKQIQNVQTTAKSCSTVVAAVCNLCDHKRGRMVLATSGDPVLEAGHVLSEWGLICFMTVESGRGGDNGCRFERGVWLGWGSSPCTSHGWKENISMAKLDSTIRNCMGQWRDILRILLCGRYKFRTLSR